MSTSTKSCRATSTDMVDIRPTRAIIHGTKTNRDVILRASDEDARRTSTVNICNQVCLRGDAGISGFPPVPAVPPNSPCQSGTLSSGHIFGRVRGVPRCPFRSQKCPQKCTIFVRCKSFRNNTYGSPRKCCKQKTYGMAKPFRCNTYKNIRGWGVPRLASLHALPSHSKSIVKERRCVLTP